MQFIFGNKEYFEITSTTNKDIIFVPKRKVEKLNLKGELEEG